MGLYGLLALAICASCIWWLLQSLEEKFPYNPQARQEITHLFHQVQLRHSKKQVQQVFRAGNYQTLKLRDFPKDNYWFVSTPLEWGARNWVLYIEYDGNGKTGALRMRVSDGPYERPHEPAPQDKVAPNWTKPFPHND